MGQAALFAIPAVMGVVSNVASGVSAQRDANAAQKAQQDALNKMLEMSDEQIQLYKDQLDNFQSVFGNVEQNLQNYYKSLSADSVAAKEIQNLEVEFNRASTQINQQLAQRGLSSSGAAASANVTLATNLALNRASARSNAEQNVANQQLSWYTLGQQQKQTALSGLSNAYSQAIGLQGNLANYYGNQASSSGQVATQSFSNIGSTINNAIGGSVVASALDGSNSQMQTTNSTGATTSSWGLPTVQSYADSLNNPVLSNNTSILRR